MRTLALLTCLVTLAIALPALAEVRPDRTRPTWAEQKLSELRHQRDWLRAENRALRRMLKHRPSVQEALRLAAITYGQNLGTLRRVAWCESRYNPRAKNRRSTASGLFQFLYDRRGRQHGSTWHTTPFAGESVWSPYANALAAGWMMGPAERGGEWACR